MIYEYLLIKMGKNKNLKDLKSGNILLRVCDKNDMFEQISKAGEEGWQMVSYTVRNEWDVIWFQRPKTPPVEKANPLEI